MDKESTTPATGTAGASTGARDDVRAQLRNVHSGSRRVVQGIADLWPLTWRATADRRAEAAWDDAFEMGRERERYDAERLTSAPAVGALCRTVRETIGLSVAEVAARVEADPVHVEELERGDEVADALTSRVARVLGSALAEGRRPLLP